MQENHGSFDEPWNLQTTFSMSNHVWMSRLDKVASNSRVFKRVTQAPRVIKAPASLYAACNMRRTELNKLILVKSSNTASTQLQPPNRCEGFSKEFTYWLVTAIYLSWSFITDPRCQDNFRRFVLADGRVAMFDFDEIEELQNWRSLNLFGAWWFAKLPWPLIEVFLSRAMGQSASHSSLPPLFAQICGR